jgi:hypothetical protein
MLTALIATLFTATAFLAMAAIGASWRNYGAAALALREQLQACKTTREFRFTLITTEVRHSGATIYRPDFRPEARGLPFQPGLRAAA